MNLILVRRVVPRVAGAALLASVVAGCANAATPRDGSEPPQASASALAPAVEIPDGAQVIELFVPDARISAFERNGAPVDSIEVESGVPYVFRVHNPGSGDHNFFIGAAEDLAARKYDRLHGQHLWSGGTRDVVYTFEPGSTLQFACTLAGHYGSMHGDFVID